MILDSAWVFASLPAVHLSGISILVRFSQKQTVSNLLNELLPPKLQDSKACLKSCAQTPDTFFKSILVGLDKLFKGLAWSWQPRVRMLGSAAHKQKEGLHPLDTPALYPALWIFLCALPWPPYH